MKVRELQSDHNFRQHSFLRSASRFEFAPQKSLVSSTEQDTLKWQILAVFIDERVRLL